MSKEDKCKNYHIAIEYWGGEIVTRYSEYLQKIRMFKNVDKYGDARVVVSSSAWYEMEHTIKQGCSEYYLMLCNGELINIGVIDKCVDIDKEFGDECVVLRISNFENRNF